MPIGEPPKLKVTPFQRKTKLGPALDAANRPLPPPKGPSGMRVEHRIGIQAPAEVIWEILYDLEGWKDWNPLYPKASGAIRIGGTLELTLALPNRTPQDFQAIVVEWVPNEQLHWRTRVKGGLIRTVRYFEIQSLAEASCIVENGEIIGGILGPRTARPMGRTIYRGFGVMNEALKERAEAVWRQRQG